MAAPPSLPIVLFALARERAPFLRRFASAAPIADLPCPAWIVRGSDGACIVAECGIGGERVRRALEAIAGRTVPPWLLFAGFGGALDETLKVGDVVTARAILDEKGGAWISPIAFPGEDRILAVDRLIGEPEEKRRLGRTYGAKAADMESGAFAAWCDARELPWLCMRGISDDVRTRLSPELFDLMAAGRVAPLRLAWSLLRRPSFLGELLRLARATRRAAASLADRVAGFMRS